MLQVSSSSSPSTRLPSSCEQRSSIACSSPPQLTTAISRSSHSTRRIAPGGSSWVGQMSISSAISPTAVVGLESLAVGVPSAAVVDVRTHTDGGQTAEAVAERVVAWLGVARQSLDLALYDVRLPGAVGDRVAAAITDAARRGVRVRIAFNQDERPPEEQHAARPFFPAPPRTEPHVLETLGVPVKPIPGWRDLMHHKYVVRDTTAVWTGSMNWTLDSWTRQENAVAIVTSRGVAAAYARNFGQLWGVGRVCGSG